MKRGRALRNVNFSLCPECQRRFEKNVSGFPQGFCPNRLLKDLLLEQAETKQLLRKILSELTELKELLTAYCQGGHSIQLNVHQEKLDKNFVENELVPLLRSYLFTSKDLLQSPAPNKNNTEEDQISGGKR